MKKYIGALQNDLWGAPLASIMALPTGDKPPRTGPPVISFSTQFESLQTSSANGHIIATSNPYKLLKPFPEIKIDNIRLRQILPDDIESVYQGLSNPEVVKYYGVSYSSLKATQRQMDWYVQLEMENKGIWWAISFENHNTLIGAIGLFDIDGHNRKAEIGFWLMPEYWGRSIVSKAAKSICEYGFNTLCLHRIEGFVSVGNRASGKLLTKLGFKLEGVLREHSVKNGSFASLEVYGLLNKLE